MRAEDVLPDHVNQGDFNGVTVRKGTIAAFLHNARCWSDPLSAPDQRAAAQRDIEASLPDLRALGLFDVLDIRDPALREWIGARIQAS
ncbi:hypothetical protein [Piscinibacter terrae]|uniref:hypothetical protein n=1 Tax=Piscinibacter terrae TaxID=2496871 RepID=UPI001F450798|nr:hypothetical protein [Albitalea terrae]